MGQIKLTLRKSGVPYIVWGTCDLCKTDSNLITLNTDTRYVCICKDCAIFISNAFNEKLQPIQETIRELDLK